MAGRRFYNYNFIFALIFIPGVLLSLTPTDCGAQTQFRGFTTNLLPSEEDLADLAATGANVAVIRLVPPNDRTIDTMPLADYMVWLTTNAIPAAQNIVNILAQHNVYSIITYYSLPLHFTLRDTKFAYHTIFLDPIAQSVYLDGVRAIAQAFRNSPSVIGIEPLNEPALPGKMKPRVLYDLLATASAIIAAEAPALAILAEPRYGDPKNFKDLFQKKTVPLHRQYNVIYAFHSYSCWNYIHQGAVSTIPGGSISYPNKKKPKCSVKDIIKYFKPILKLVKKYPDMRYFMTEETVSREAPNHHLYLSDQHAVLESFGFMGWAFHQWRNRDIWDQESPFPTAAYNVLLQGFSANP